MMELVLETERLRLRKFTREDAGFIVTLLNTPGWIKYIGDRNVRTDLQAIHYLENGPLRSYQHHGFGLWMVELKKDSTPVGMCGILKRETLENPDIGFAFLPQFTRQGLAYEAADASLQYALNSLKLPVISGITLPDNVSSIRILEKIGLKLVKAIRFPGSQEELLLYSTNGVK
jgi:RimJ/RimL family protein N-acetyltransferase